MKWGRWPGRRGGSGRGGRVGPSWRGRCWRRCQSNSPPEAGGRGATGGGVGSSRRSGGCAGGVGQRGGRVLGRRPEGSGGPGSM